ncbi:A-kinase anchor protein 9 isoform X3 [Clarias gariepinus]|uniref:A-kinase anchor protein 9 isoform X3 n=1 Tax=Clarias gariepinus TaxID=13013 RepID=UPI00234C5DFC|nr:A-kinase anchor protein 9 isoform X3 [Clarias gariepinus]
MEDEERRRKVEAGKAKLAEYRQKKAQSDGQKKKKKKKNKESEPQDAGGDRGDGPAPELPFSRTLRSGETVQHDQMYTIEPESEISTTAEDYSSEVNGHDPVENAPDVGEEELCPPSRLQEMESELAAKNMAVEELSRELEEIRATFGAEGVQQLQDFEAALKQRDGIITQLTANLQQARAEKDEVMREFLDLTEKSQKLQIQFQQLQAGESIRSSSISSAAADLLQARHQVLLYQQQLDEKDAAVKNLQMQLEKRDGEIKGLQEQVENQDKNVSTLHLQLDDQDSKFKVLQEQTVGTEQKVKHLQEQLQESETRVSGLQEQMLEMTKIQERMSELETVSRDTEESFIQRLNEKDSRIQEQERLILEHQQSLSHLRNSLQESEKRFLNITKQLEAKVHDLEGCEAELQASKERERLSSSEILQLMGTVEVLQKRYHQGSQSEGEALQRAELDATRRLDHLRAELDEMYGQQIVQMKHELLSRHKEEMSNILNQHSTELRNVSDQHRVETERLTSQLTQSTGEVNTLNVRMIELQQRLQEMQVLREKAEHDLKQTSEEKVLLQNQVQKLTEDLRLKNQEKSQSEIQLQLHAIITDLQAQLASVQEASRELEAKHESEITNYRIKLEMLEREKDAVLDRMAESQEAELERLRTQLLFSHEEELSRLREDLHHESQMNVENLRDELNQRHEVHVQQLRKGFEEQLKVVENEKLILAEERTSMLQEIVTLKNDLSQALEKSRVEELVSQLKVLQVEIHELRQRQSEKGEPDVALSKNELTMGSEQNWERMESENKLLKETNASLAKELSSLQKDHKMLLKKMDTQVLENRQANVMAEELRAEIERQKSTFSFAEKNFEVNFQELRAELEEQLREQTLQYEAKLRNLKPEMEHGSFPNIKAEDEEPEGGALVEKDTTELMEKLQSVELERAGLVKQVEQKETEIKTMILESAKLLDQIKSVEVKFRRVEQENTVLLKQVEQKEAKVKMVELERAGLVKQLEQKGVELKRLELERADLEEQTKSKDLELKRAELDKLGMEEQVHQKEAVLQQEKVELETIKLEKAELVKQVEQKEAELENIKMKLMEQKEVLLQQKEVEFEKIKLEKADLEHQVEQKEAVLQQNEAELKTMMQDKAALVAQVEQKEVALQEKEVELKKIKVELMRQKAVLLKQKEAELKTKLGKTEPMQQKKAELEKTDLVEQKEVVLQEKEVELEKMKVKLLKKVEQKEAALQQKEAEIESLKLENAELVKQVEQTEVVLHRKEVELQKTENEPRVQLPEPKEATLQQKQAKLQSVKLGKVELTDPFQVKKAGLKAGRKARQKVSRFRSLETKPDRKKQNRPQSQCSEVEREDEEAGKTGKHLAPPPSQAAEEEESAREADACVVHRSDGVKQKTHARAQPAAAAATRSHTLTRAQTHTQPAAAAATHADGENKPASDSQKQVESQYGELCLVPAVTQTDMEGLEHEECRLQMEAQRISLSQIHAAQLELLRESLPEWEEFGRQGGAKACSPSLISITQDCTHLLQLISDVCGVDVVDVTDQQLQNLQPSTIREIITTTREVYQKLQQLDTGVSSSHTGFTLSENRNEAVCDDPSLRTEDDVHTSTLNDLQEELQEGEVEQKLELQEEEVEQKLELQEEEVEQKLELQEEVVEQKLELQEEEVEQKLELQEEEVEQKLELQEEEVEQKLELQEEEVEQKLELQEEEVEQKLELQEEQHREEIQHLRSYYSEQIRETEERYTSEILLLQDQLQDMTREDTRTSMSSISAQEQQLQKRQSEMEEEIARVIVQMSVEFARQSELKRISLRQQEEDMQGAEPERVIEEEEETEREGVERWRPSMQCSSTQTETQRRRGEGDEDKQHGERDEEVAVTSPVTSSSSSSSSDSQDRVHQVLTDMLKMTAVMEDRLSAQPLPLSADVSEVESSSLLSGATDTDEGLDMFQEAGPGVEGAGSVWSVSCKLQKAVEKLLITLSQTHTQLEHAQVTQTELMKEKFSYDQQISDLLLRQEELQQRLEEERRAREKLTLQLQHAEGLIDGYSGERRALEEQVREGASLQQQLEAELQMTNHRLQELQQERQEVSDQQDLLLQQHDVTVGGATEAELSLVEAAVDDAPEAGLLEETEKLMQEKVDVQRQAQKDHAEFLEQVKQLETELDEQVRAMTKLEETHLSESADLRQQIHALEKQLENNRRFLDEQAADREHERDVFQQEIQKLEQQLKSSSKPQADHSEVEELSTALQEKADWCSELLLRVEQLQRDVQERDEEIERQEERVRVLEEVLVSHDITPSRENSKQYASMAGGADVTLEALLQTEREALDRKEKEIVNLEEQLEQFRDELQNKSEEVQQLHMQLEIQRKEISTQQQDLQAHTSLHTVLEEKNKQITLLNEQIAKLQLSETTKTNDKEVEVKNELVRELKSQVEYLRAEQDHLKRDSEEEVEQLNSVIEKLQQELSKIEHKQSSELEEEDEQDQHDERKQKMDQIQRELDTLKEDHSSLIRKYESLQEERETKAEKKRKNEMLVLELEDMLREKTAALVVAQVQIQALEESATSTVDSLTRRVKELENCLTEREVELRDCKSEVDKAQSEAGTLHLKIFQLEERLEEKNTTLSQLVNQEHLETKTETKEFEENKTCLDNMKKGLELKVTHEKHLVEPLTGEKVGLKQQGGIVEDQEKVAKELESKVAGEQMKLKVDEATAGLMESCSEMEVKNLILLMEKLNKLEMDLSSMPKDQELQKLLLASSEDEVDEYEKILAKLMELLNQIKTTPTSPAETSTERTTETEKLIQELQELKHHLEAAREELHICRIQNQGLQEQIQCKEDLIEKLQEDVHRISQSNSEQTSTVMSALHQELHEVKGQAEAAKEELNVCKELSQRLQAQLQMSGEVESSELLQELQGVKQEAAATKEELNSYIEQSLKLQEQIQARDTSIAQLMEEIQQLRTALFKSGEEKDLSSSKKKPGREHHGKVKGGNAAKDKDKQTVSRKNSSTPPLAPSANGAPNVSSVDVGIQVEGPELGAELGAELEEVISEYTERIGQIRELHAAEIMDMENRHIAESESLKKENQRLEQECDALRGSINKLRPLQVVRPDHSASSPFRDGYTSDSSSDVGLEFRSTPEGARPDDTHLPGRIKALLREVHQEGMQVLSLSELSVCDDSADCSSLLAQITHLQTQLAQLQQSTHTTQQLPHTPGTTETDECERLRAELAQVRLELNTAQRTQHTHLRELGTLRAEVCVKASELDSASDRLAEEQRRARELQWEVERERGRADRRAEGEREELEDVRLALEEERQVSAQREAELSKYISLSTQLQVQLESQNCRLNELSSDLQKEKELNAELLKHTERPLQMEDGIPSVTDHMIQSLQSQLKEKQATLLQLRTQAEQRTLQDLEQRQQWQNDRTCLQRRVDELQSLLEGERERVRDVDREKERLERRVAELIENNERTGDRVSVWNLDNSVVMDSIGTPLLSTARATDIRDMESVITRLQQITSKISRAAVEGADRDSFTWLQRNLQDVLSFLQKGSSELPAGPESAILLTGGLSSLLTERLLRQNAELTGFVSRLTEEKNELRNQILSLEEELRRLRHLKDHSVSSLRPSSEVPGGVLEVQREAWLREKRRMEKSLCQAEAELSRLRAEVRSDAVRDLSTSDNDNAALKRIYGKYLRSESFRKALIYQKKYLLLLLGGFQECEEATLSLIASMTGPHGYTHTAIAESVSHRRRGYTRFRSAARVCIALSRMRFLVRRWQKVTGGSITIHRNGVGQSPVMEVRNDSPYLQPYGERRGTQRGRTGRESPHATHTAQHRCGGMSTDGGVMCSHLQNYDPDRALSDYITRLEALQRRLGSVQSGSSSYTQLHFGMRR